MLGEAGEEKRWKSGGGLARVRVEERKVFNVDCVCIICLSRLYFGSETVSLVHQSVVSHLAVVVSGKVATTRGRERRWRR